VFCVIYWLELSAHIFNVFRAGGGGRHVAPPGAGGRARLRGALPLAASWRGGDGYAFFYSYRFILLTI